MEASIRFVSQSPFLHENNKKPFSQISQKRRRDAQSDTCVYASSSITANPINKLFNHSYSQPPANHFSPFPFDPKDAGIAWRRPLSKVWRWQNSDLDSNVSASKFGYMHPDLDPD